MDLMIYKLILFLCLVFPEPSLKEDVLEWQEKVPLKWSDFKGQPQNLGDIAAITSSGISFRFSIKENNQKMTDFNTQVQAHFYPKKSWVHKKKSSDHLLAHEQLHFDITELYARKLRKEIAQMSISQNIKQRLNQRYERINKAMTAVQQTYDVETNYSRDSIAQSIWKLKIDASLKDFSDYKNPPNQ